MYSRESNIGREDDKEAGFHKETLGELGLFSLGNRRLGMDFIKADK